jgi:hypothetical protein
MKIRNAKVPEGINVSKHSPLADLFVLTAGAIGLFTALGLAAFMIGIYGGRYLPMSWENAMAAAVFESEEIKGDDDEKSTTTARDRNIQTALQALADRTAWPPTWTCPRICASPYITWTSPI